MDVLSKSVSRRSFLQKLVGATLGSTALVFFIPVIRYLMPAKSEGRANVLTNADGVAILDKEIAEGESIVGLSRDGPTVVLRRGGLLRAFSAVCTHLGCIVKWIPEEGIFLCPCHAGKFDANGVNVGGPPPSPLAAYDIEIDKEGRIVLETT